MLRISHFEILALDPERAANFYITVFGWDIKKEALMDYWTVVTGSDLPGINGGLMKHSEVPAIGAANAFICTIDVSDYDSFEEKILDAGGTKYQAKHVIPGYGWHGYFKDTEGNTFGIFEAMKQSK